MLRGRLESQTLTDIQKQEVSDELCYHFTNKDNLNQILKEGLYALSGYNSLESKIRRESIYAWLIAEHDTMGYLENKNFVCLEIRTDYEKCIIANMDMISAAFVNFIGAGGQIKNIDLSKKLVKLYDNSTIKLSEYVNGLFRTPEVIIKEYISPEYIRVLSEEHIPRYKTSFSDNKVTYENKILRKIDMLVGNKKLSIYKKIQYLLERNIIQRVAVHDDSYGLLIRMLCVTKMIILQFN